MSGSRAANQEVPAGQARRTDADEVRVTELPATGAAVASGHQGGYRPQAGLRAGLPTVRSTIFRNGGSELCCRLDQLSRPQQC